MYFYFLYNHLYLSFNKYFKKREKSVQFISRKLDIILKICIVIAYEKNAIHLVTVTHLSDVIEITSGGRLK